MILLSVFLCGVLLCCVWEKGIIDGVTVVAVDVVEEGVLFFVDIDVKLFNSILGVSRFFFVLSNIVDVLFFHF
jgi:hypothetical protein